VSTRAMEGIAPRRRAAGALGPSAAAPYSATLARALSICVLKAA
jgi:hypothetical protein